MKTALLQLWEESINDNSIIPDGCSLHINSTYRDEYIENIYSDRSQSIKDNYHYDRFVGDYLIVFIDERLYKIIEKRKTIKLSQVEMSNLLNFNEIVIDE